MFKYKLSVSSCLCEKKVNIDIMCPSPTKKSIARSNKLRKAEDGVAQALFWLQNYVAAETWDFVMFINFNICFFH